MYYSKKRGLRFFISYMPQIPCASQNISTGQFFQLDSANF